MKKLWLAGVAGMLLLVSGCGYQAIPPGSVGVKFNGSSGISKTLLKPEVVWVGFNEKLIIYPTNIQNATFVANANEGDRLGDDSIKASTREGAVLPVDVSVAYRIESAPDNIQRVFQTFGDEEITKIQRHHVRWATVVAVNEVSGQKSIFDLISRQRAQFGPEVKKVLSPMLEGWGLKVEDVLIREIHPPQEITDRITEQQNKRSELEQIKVEKQQAITDAQTVIVQAQQKAEENRLLSQQGEQAIALKKLERRRKFIEKWNGKSPLIGTGPIPTF